MSVSSRRRPRSQRRCGRGHSSPSRPRSRPGRGRFGACEAAPAAGRPGSGHRAAARLFVRRPRSGGTRARPPPARRRRAQGQRPKNGRRGTVGPPLGGSPAGSIFVRGASQGAVGRGSDPDPAPRPGSRAGVPGERPSARGGMRGPAALSAPAPGAPRGGRATGVGRGPRARPGESGDARQGGRPARAGLTDGFRASPRTFVGRKRGPREEGMDLVFPQSGFPVKNAAIWRLAVPGLAPKVEFGQRLDTNLDRCSGRPLTTRF
ncbi:nuclear transcription factor Y subunit beta isoform X1 [Saccopteryx bilineata]|uniref:nuclear transcription factor Y subunit beta isoform X1 n=1 Tax=Saccopteryx bilineata TaxID=59482 RepID=UPI003390055A